MTFLLWTLAVAMVTVGLIGVVMPALPGHMLILGGLIVGAWANGFARVGVWTLVAVESSRWPATASILWPWPRSGSAWERFRER